MSEIKGVRAWTATFVVYEWLPRRIPRPYAFNYGYAPAEPLVAARGSDNVFQLTLYDRLVRAAPLQGGSGLRVLEVGCGLGVGAGYVLGLLGGSVAQYVGVDRSSGAVAFCRRHASDARAEFRRGNALALPVEPGFDVVINVESSHAYPSMPKFLGEVARVLRPGGWFLWADFRPAEEVAALTQAFEAAGLGVVATEDITANVMASLDADAERKARVIAEIRRRVSGPERALLRRFDKLFQSFAGMPGSELYDSFRNGRRRYLTVVARREGGR